MKTKARRQKPGVRSQESESADSNSSFLLPPSSFSSVTSFTLIELLTVISIIVLLAGIIIGTASFANRKSLESKTRSQFHQITLALELYKNDVGYYPVSPYAWPRTNAISHEFNAGVNISSVATTNMWSTSNTWAFYRALTGCSITNSPQRNPDLDRQNFYLEIKPDQVQSVSGTNYLVDPYGNIWGYFNGADATTRTNQYNSRSYDFWSFGLDPKEPTNSLISNWRR